jgi:signal transduction histidine kinase
MRWWLALVFAAIVALTALAVAQVLTSRSVGEFRERAEELAAGTALTAANAVLASEQQLGLPEAAATTARERGIGIFLFGPEGRQLTPVTSNGVSIASVESIGDLLPAALEGRRLVESEAGGRRIVVALPLRSSAAGAMIAVASRPDLVAAGDIVRGEWAATLAIAIGAGLLVGTLVAFAITSRIRRIAVAAAEIEQGRWDEPLRPRFHDEVGRLAATVDGMREHLRDSFDRLSGERDRLLSLLEQLQEGVIAVDRELRVVFANSRAKLVVGRRSLAEGAPLPAAWGGGALREVAGGLFEPVAAVTTRRVAPDPESVFSVAGVPVGPQGDTALLVLADITLADRRERAEREFVANAAHELRTPLAAISGAVEVLQAGAKEDPGERDRFLAVVERQSTRLGRLVRALLTLARAQTRAEPIVPEPVELAPLLEEVAADLADRSEVAIEVDAAPGLAALGHRDLLLQAVSNLAENALGHAGATRVRLHAGPAERGRVRVEVRDDGAGIPARLRERVFDRFYRGPDRDSAGFGLGLPIVREVAAALGGEVEIEPGEAGGTTAAIVLRDAAGDGRPRRPGARSRVGGGPP